MITYTAANSKNDLEGILKLQKANLPQGLTPDEIRSQGFVTVNHSFDLLAKLNDLEKHIIAKDKEQVVGYVLAMTQHSRYDIPILIPMFDVFDAVRYNGKTISEYNYLIIGQVCVDKEYRGQGVFDNCYAAYREHYSGKYDFAITEIASSNPRSINAHKRVGFKEINSYTDPDGTEWVIVVWNWKN